MAKKKRIIKEMTMQQQAALIVLVIAGLIGVIWYGASITLPSPGRPQYNFPVGIEDRVILEQYLRSDMTNLSAEKPRDSVEQFKVTGFRYPSASTVEVDYDDGLFYYTAEVDFTVEEDVVDGERSKFPNVFAVRIIDKQTGKRRPPVLDDEKE